MDYLSAKPTAVAIGNFDGVHLGHKAVLDKVLQLAAAEDLVPAVLTFEPHPREVLRPDEPLERLTNPQQKIKLLTEYGIKQVHVMTFNDALRQLTPQAFVEQELRPLIPAHVVVGENFRFGHKAAGDVVVLQAFGVKLGFGVHAVGPVTCDAGTPVSSSRIRAAIAEQNYDVASQLLGRLVEV